MAHYPTWFQRGPDVEVHWGPLLQILEGHDATVNAVAYSFDGKFLASMSKFYELLLWDATTGTLHSTLFEGSNRNFPFEYPQSARSYLGPMFSRNGQLACVSSVREVRVWDPVTETTVRKLVHNENREIRAVAFASNGTLAISYVGVPAQTWIYKAGANSMGTKVETEFEARSLSFSSTGTLALACFVEPFDRSGEILLHNIEKHLQLRIPIETAFMPSFSSNNKLALAYPRYPSNRLCIYGLETGSRQAWEFEGSDVSTLAFSTSNRGLFLGCSNGYLHYLSLESGTKKFIWAGVNPIQSIAPSSGGKLAIAFLADQAVRILEVGSDARSAGDLATASISDGREKPWSRSPIPLPSGGVEKPQGPVTLIVFSHDGKQLAYVSFNDTFVIDSTTGRELCHLQKSIGLATTVNENYLASGDNGATVRVWDLASGDVLRVLRNHSSKIVALAFSPDNRTLVSVHGNISVHGNTFVDFWDLKTWGLIQDITIKKSPDEIISAAFSQNGKSVAFLRRDSLQIWDANRYICLHYFQVRIPLSINYEIRISAFVEESYIDTTFGRIQLADPLKFEEGPWEIHDNWLCYNAQRLLWLPPDFRPNCIARYHDLLVLGHESGKLSFFDGNTTDSPPRPSWEATVPESTNKGKRKALEYLHHQGEGAGKHRT